MIRLLIASLLISGTVACQAEPIPTPQAAVEAVAPVQEVKQPEEKTVCINVWNAQQQKTVKKCRTLKIHEKKEGTKVPQ